MFEVILCNIHSGKVEHGLFATRTQAEDHVRAIEERILSRKPRPGSLRDWRIEIIYRPQAIQRAQASRLAA
jgi:hypothetical protein